MAKKNEGKEFESQWKESYTNTNYFYLRLRDSAKWVQEKESRFTPENPCDSIQYSMPYLFMLELKSNGSGSISFSPFTSDGYSPWSKPKGSIDKDIKTNQVKELMEFAKKDGVIAGLVLNFRERALKTKTEPNETFFLHISDFINFAKSSDKSSINREDCKKIGLMINAKKKKVKYTYDVKSFIDDCINKCLKDGYLDFKRLLDLMSWIKKLELESWTIGS